MPYFKIETSQEPDFTVIRELPKKASVFISDLLGKPENWVMISINYGTEMMFGGNSKPAAHVELKSIGLSKENCADLSEAICNFIEEELRVPATRIYIDFRNIEKKQFGWNRTTF
ncbi:phenylpyruvate tautomerase MIF-related protein [Desulfococcaceae bacterium HSG8]|nr:phenylpyruvate tautomerase MIF-related protein [Desulfococcaceae bacterium HSG8]